MTEEVKQNRSLVRSRCRLARDDDIQMVFKGVCFEHAVSVHVALESVRLG
jgi:hypothetical protein